MVELNKLTPDIFLQEGYYTHFSHYQDGDLYYSIEGWVQYGKTILDRQLREFVVPIPVKELGTNRIEKIEPVKVIKRFIVRAIEEGTIRQVWPKPKKIL